MRFRLGACLIVVSAGVASAQTARVSGRVIEEGRGTPVIGATVRLTGSTGQVTDSAGRFQFGDVVSGRYLVTVSSIGYRFRTIELDVARDTSVVFQLARRVVSLDTVIVRPKYLRIKATAVDSATGDYLLQAQATLYPGGRFAGATSGVSVFDSVSAGQTTIVIEALEHLPVRIELDLTSDTTIRVPMAVDSVALRMIAMQVKRVEQRSRAIAMPTTALNRDAIQRERVMSMGELIDRRSYGFIDPKVCYVLDDRKAEREELTLLLPELVERIELFRRGGAEAPKFGVRSKGDRNFGSVLMIRIYTKRYVATLPRQATLPKVIYMQNGTAPACS